MPTAYPYPVGANPQFDAFKAKYDYNVTNLNADADQRRKKADEDYQAALSSLNTQGVYGRRNLDTNLISRGVFHSGEANRKRAELEGTLLQGRSSADLSRANALGSVSADLQRAMNGLSIDWEQAIAGLRKSGGSGGGGMTGPSAAAPAAIDWSGIQAAGLLPGMPYAPPAAEPFRPRGATGWQKPAPKADPRRTSRYGAVAI